MKRMKVRVLLVIAVICQVTVLLLRHYRPESVDLKDFFTGAGTTILAGAMIMMMRKPKVQP